MLHTAELCVSNNENGADSGSDQPTNGQRAKLRSRSKSIAEIPTTRDITAQENTEVEDNDGGSSQKNNGQTRKLRGRSRSIAVTSACDNSGKDT